MKKNFNKMIAAVLTAGTMIFSISAMAEYSNAEATYVALPMGMFKMLTNEQCKSQSPEYYLYLDGKLEKCTTDLGEQMQQNCQKGDKQCKMNKPEKFGKNRSGFDKFSGFDREFVLLTVNQLETLKKQKMEQKLSEVNNKTDRMSQCLEKASQNAVTVKINGQDAKVITMGSMRDGKMKNGNCPMNDNAKTK